MSNSNMDESLKAVPLERALELTGFGRYNHMLFAISILSFVTMVLNTFGVSMTVAASSCELDLTTKSKGILSSMPLLGMVLSAYLWGWLADTRGRKWVLVKALWSTCVITLIGSFSFGWQMLTVAKFCSAFFASAANSVTYALFSECTPLSQRNRYLLMLSCGIMFGPAFMAIIGYPVLITDINVNIPFVNLRYRSWRLLEQIFALMAGLNAILIMKIAKESPKFYASRARDHECLESLRQIFCSNTGKKEEQYPVLSISFEETVIKAKDQSVIESLAQQTAPFCQPPLRHKTLIISYIVVVAYVVSPSFLIWMPTISNTFFRAIATGITGESFCHIINAESNDTAYIYNVKTGQRLCKDTVESYTYITLLLVSAMLATLTVINSLLLKFICKRTLIIFYNCFTGFAGILIPFVYSNPLSAVLFFTFVLNLLCIGIITSFAVEVYPTYLRAMAVCLTIIIGRGCSLLSIMYTGTMLELYCEQMFFTYGFFVISAAFVSLLLPPDAITYGR